MVFRLSGTKFLDAELCFPCGQLRSKEAIKVVLTKPFSIDGESEADYRAPNLIQRILSLFKNVRPGSDLSHFKLPPLFNLPKSHLQCYGEQVYCTGTDMLTRCNVPDNPLERFLSVVAFSISTSRPLVFGVVPFNPVLGETHHVSRATLNVVLEQISHHPPVSALHATDEEHNIELIWCQQCISKFTGASVDAEVRGKRQLKLRSRGETYEMNSPNLLIRFLPLPGADWAGNVGVRCKETGFEAELLYGSKSFLGLRGTHRSVKGKIYETSTKKILFELNGNWDRTVTVKDNNSGELRVIYNSEEVYSGLRTPVVKDLQGVESTESAAVWSKVSEAIMSRNWEKAKEAKNAVEEKQREVLRGMESEGKTWVPQHFGLSCSKDGVWECSPTQQWVPPAPIVVPLT
ncbi:oxysterol-binding protein-related protein 4C-like [Hibiscus syriacus]|uniref:oxysterol-binding protein-related protein 4C-like n=1 Tax=Hibiscus syriacus TaxID=106335 RepID=UPI00192388DC|nr:oxysterol-binding protein-related protein 4C-like [Hibiscus syriacus]